MHPEQQLSIARNSEGVTSMAVISTEGAALRKLVLRDAQIIDDSRLANPLSIKFGSLLAPWPNRLAEGRYKLNSREFQSSKLDPFGNAIHGLLYDRIVEVENHDESSVTFRHLFGQDSFYPFSVELRVRYELHEDELLVTATANNLGEPAPFGIGFHPYFLAGEEFTVKASFTNQIMVDEKLIPQFSTDIDGLLYSGGKLDSCFFGTDVIHMTTKDFSIDVKLLEGYEYTMLYRPPIELGESLLAIEPMSCPANAFNSTIEELTMQTGETKRFAFSIKTR